MHDDTPFLEIMFRVLDAGLSAEEAQLARDAVEAEHTKWRGSMNWGGAVSSCVVVALRAVADARQGDK